jgi:hypothetical protein
LKRKLEKGKWKNKNENIFGTWSAKKQKEIKKKEGEKKKNKQSRKREKDRILLYKSKPPLYKHPR